MIGTLFAGVAPAIDAGTAKPVQGPSSEAVVAGFEERANSIPEKTPDAAAKKGALERIGISNDSSGFVRSGSGAAFVVWGVNYDHDADGRLIEDYWTVEWQTVVKDFSEIKALGANVVRIHLQVARFMDTPRQPNAAALKQLERLVALAEDTGLYLNITGLGCYHKDDVPAWYDTLPENERWDVQALFWEAVAGTCAHSPAVFCYDLMNEPVIAGGSGKESKWLAGEFGGKHFVQRISLDLAGRTREQVAKAWVDQLVTAIRRHDRDHLITVGVIPWAYTWPNAKPVFYSDGVGDQLDFVSVHFYPKEGDTEKAIKALAVYDIGKPLVIEEMYPLRCGIEEMDRFIDASREFTDGWISFYWGKTPEEYEEEDLDLAGAIQKTWLVYFRAKGQELLGKPF